ncbi:HPr family phosphocarrier protein [Desulfobacterales bacterium HSG2]|nr:HPr family phosphocarrier protein [Desulfobacterales bacterium HSG2]
MKEFLKDVVIINELGLHARAAARIAEVAGNAKSKMWIIKGDEVVDAASIVDLLTLGCAKGSNITIKIESLSDVDTLNRVAELIENGFGE